MHDTNHGMDHNRMPRVWQVLDPIASVVVFSLCDSLVGANLAASLCVMSAEASGILDTGNTIGIPNFDGSHANWDSRRVKFEAYADLANRGTHLDVAAETSTFIRHNLSNSVHALLIAKCEVRSSVSGLAGSLTSWP